MPAERRADMIREAVAYFDSADALEEAVDELMESGFDPASIERN